MIDRSAFGSLHELRATVSRVRFGEVRRVAQEAVGQFAAQRFVDPAGEGLLLLRAQEELQTRAPAMICGHLVVEPQRLRTGADQGGAVRQAGE